MRHRNRGRKLSRNTEHRRALLRNLVTSLILQERIKTTVAKAKAARPIAERMITLGKRYASRVGGYTRIVHAGWRAGDGADMAVLELVGTEALQRLAQKRAKKAEARRKKVEEEAAAPKQEPGLPDEGEEKK